jgi:uncharacterized protein (DUF433 family)
VKRSVLVAQFRPDAACEFNIVMDLHEHIEMKFDVLCGKAALRESRLRVDHIVGLLA